MKIRTPITLALLIAAIATPAARTAISPDAFERAVNRHQASAPDVFERAVNRHQSNLAAVYPDDRLGPRAADPASLGGLQIRGASSTKPVSVYPDDRRSLRYASPSYVSLTNASAGTSAFSWREFALGAGAMLGLVLVLSGIGVATRAMRSNRSHLPSM